MNEKAVRLTVNGSGMNVTCRTLADLLRHLHLDEKTVVAEINGEIIQPEAFATRELYDADSVELVRFVGGG